ncbi:DUF1496 domain-containing protein [Vibrio panuliri]|nr:DUF1496 domain-containing protein [Vibrio panuliri]
MERILLMLVTLLPLTSIAGEKSYSTPNHRAAIVFDGQAVNQRVCYYQDQAYSEGAILEVGGYLMRCDNAHQFESNGRVKWVSFEKPQTEQTSKP